MSSNTFTCSRAEPLEELGMVSRCDSSSGMKLSRRHLEHSRVFEVRRTSGKVEYDTSQTLMLQVLTLRHVFRETWNR